MSNEAKWVQAVVDYIEKSSHTLQMQGGWLVILTAWCIILTVLVIWKWSKS